MPREDKDWYKYANVRFTMCVASKLDEESYAREEITITKELGCDTIVFFVENEGRTIYDSKMAPKDPLVGDRDLLADLVAEAKKEEIRVVAAWYGSHCQTYLVEKHPEWRVKRLDSRKKQDGDELSIETASYDLSTMCYNSPFRQWLLDQMREVMERYDVAGVYIDGMNSPLGTCCCNYCRGLYQKEHGHDIPTDIWDKQWREFGYRTVTSAVKAVREVIDEARPEAVFVLDCHGTIIGLREAGEPIFMTAPYVDVLILECYWNICKEPPYYVGMESRLIRSETQKHVWCPKWLARNPDQDYANVSPTAAKVWLMEALSSGATPVSVDQGTFWFDRTCFDDVRKGHRHVKKLKADLVKSKPVRYAALFHSMESKSVRIHKTLRNERQHFEGFYMACQEAHIPFDVITEKEVLDGSISEYPVLILPNVEYMSDKVAQAIERYVQRGGGLVMTHLTGLYDEKEKKRDDLALARLGGVRYTGEILQNGTPQGEKGTTNYYQAVGDHEMTMDLGTNTYSYKGDLTVVEAGAETNVLIRTRNYAGLSGREKESYFRWWPGELACPFVMVKDDGGRVVYIAGELDAAFWSFGWPEAGKILSRSVTFAAQKELPFTTDCPEPVMITELASDDGDTMIFLMVNYATNNLYSIGFPGGGEANTQDQSRANEMRYSIVHKDITLTVPDTFSSARAVTGQTVVLSRKNGKTLVNIPRIDEYEALILTK